MESMAGYMNQMTRVLAATDEEGDKAARALQKIGINFQDFQALDPAEKMAKLGQEMGRYGDGVAKTEILQAIFGRGAGAVGKALKVLANEQAFNTKLTGEMISRVDDLNDSNALWASQTKQAVQFLTIGATPAISAFTAAMGTAVMNALGLGKGMDSLASNKAIEEFAKGAVTLIGEVIEAVQIVSRTVEFLISGITSLAKATVAAAKLDWGGVEAAFAEHAKTTQDILKRELFGKTLRDAQDKQLRDRINAEADAAEQTLTIVKGKTDAEIAEEKKKAAELAKLIKKQDEDFAKMQEGASLKAAGLDPGFIEDMKLINIQLQRRNITETQYRQIVDDLLQQQPYYTDGLKEQAKAAEDYIKAETDAYENAKKDRDAQLKASNEAVAAAQAELEGRGKLKSEIGATTLLRLEEQLVVHQSDPIMKAHLEAMIANQKKINAALKGVETIDAAKKGAEEIKKAYEKAWDQIGQSLTDQLMKGSLNAKELIENLFKTMILRPTIMAAAQGIGSSFMGSAVGGATGGAVGGGGGGGGFGGTMGSLAGQAAGSSLFAGVGTAATTTYSGAMAAGLPAANAIGMGAGAGLAAIPVAGWIALAAVAAYAAYKKWGNHKGGPKVEGSAGFEAGSLIGNMGNAMDANAMRAVSDLSTQYRRMAQMLGSSRQEMGFGVGYSMDPAGTAPSMVQIRSEISESVDRNAGRTAEELQKALAAGSAKVMVEALRNSGMDAQMLAYFDEVTVGMTDEAKLGAFEQVAAVGKYWKSMQAMGYVVKGFSSISLEAAVSLAELSGGIENLSAGISGYVANFFTDTEQLSIGYQALANQLNQAGTGWEGFSETILRTWSKEHFREVVEGLNLAEEGDRMRYASLMQAAGAFAELDKQARAANDSINDMWMQIRALGTQGSYLSRVSQMAADRLVDLAGGVDNLASSVATYHEKFFTDAEKESMAYQQMAASLNEAGSGWTGYTEAILRSYSPARLRQIIEGLNLEDEGDRMRYISLLKIAGTFAELKDSSEAVAKATERYDNALENLRGAYDRQKDVLTTTRDAMKSATQSFLDFNDSLRVDQALSTLNPQERMAELERQYSEARQQTVMGGYKAEDVARMQETARALLQGGREMYASGAGYDDLFKRITEEMEGAAGATRYRQDIAENQLHQLEVQVGYLVSIDTTLISVNEALWELNSARSEVYALGYPHAEGLSRVPFNNYPALLHQDEMVLPQNESAFLRGLPDFSGELRALRQEVTQLRRENRQDAGNTIGATFTAAQQSAQVQSEATIRAARQRMYQSRSRPVLA